ncbi:MAG: dTDP-4-dehydrorhamnose 3,5-epimerase family protein [Dongiaceae bacterium]
MISGEIVIGLHDLRPGMPGAGRSTTLRLNSGQLQMLIIPTGVAHGFYSRGVSTYVIGTSGYYDPTDHRRCRWDCPELNLDWPCTTPELSPPDRDAPGYAELKGTFVAAMAAARSQA